MQNEQLPPRNTAAGRLAARRGAPVRRWDPVRWRYSAILPVSLVLLIITMAFSGGGNDPAISASLPGVSLKVTDAVNGSPLAGAQVVIGSQTILTDATGVARFDPPATDTQVSVSMAGYSSVTGLVPANVTADQAVVLSAAPATAVPTATSASVEPTTAPTLEPTIDPAAVAGQLTGSVVNDDGAPIAEALVRIGTWWTLTDASGTFAIQSDGATEAVVSASGYADQVIPIGGKATVQMVRQDIRAVYLNGSNAADPEMVQSIIDLTSRTNINAVVVDIKDTIVYYDTGVQFFRDADAVEVVYDPAALIQQLHDAGLYVIARLVVFKDPLVAQAHPEFAVLDETTGGLWLGWQGEAWVNPFAEGLWQPNIDLAVEAANLGFDEIQYDYIRFPSDGDLSIADFGPDYSEEGRVSAITRFLELSHNALRPTGAKLAADVFGIITLLPDDQGIGQRFADVVQYLDYVCPMVYPSHFDEGALFGLDGAPNDYPYEVILQSMMAAQAKMPGMELKLRPWLQDFTIGGMTAYGPYEVRQQIDASADVGTTGWLLWNPDNVYTEEALDPAA